MTFSAHKTIVLGSEHDEALRGALRDVLRRLGAKNLAHEWCVGGSQELERAEIRVGAERVIVEAETFVGLSIHGPAELADRIRRLVVDALNQR